MPCHAPPHTHTTNGTGSRTALGEMHVKLQRFDANALEFEVADHRSGYLVVHRVLSLAVRLVGDDPHSAKP